MGDFFQVVMLHQLQKDRCGEIVFPIKGFLFSYLCPDSPLITKFPFWLGVGRKFFWTGICTDWRGRSNGQCRHRFNAGLCGLTNNLFLVTLLKCQNASAPIVCEFQQKYKWMIALHFESVNSNPHRFSRSTNTKINENGYPSFCVVRPLLSLTKPQHTLLQPRVNVRDTLNGPSCELVRVCLQLVVDFFIHTGGSWE